MTAYNRYSAVVLADSPLAYYRLADTSGTVATDSSGNSHNGTIVNAPTLNVTSLLLDTPDLSDKATTFSAGSSQCITLPTTFTPTGSHAWSIEAWIRMSSVPGSGYMAIAAFGANNLKQSAQIKILGGSPAVFVCSGFNADITGGTVSANTTYHVVGTYDGASLRLYVNATLVAGPTAYALTVHSDYAQIAADFSTEYFSGTIDEVAIYNSALSSGKITTHYNAGRGIITKSLGVRTRLATKKTKTLGVRTRMSPPHTWSLGVRSRLGVLASKSLGVRTVLQVPAQVVATIGNGRVIFDEDSFQWHQTVDERQRCQFTVLDYPGVASYASRQQVTVTDPTLGTLFTGVVIDSVQDKTNEYPDPTIEHQIDTVDNTYFVDKRTSSRQYTTPTYAGKIALDCVIDALGAEGILAPYAQRVDTTATDWASGALNNTTATMNVGDGDLELLYTGPAVLASYAVAADWNTGTISNLLIASGGDLSLGTTSRTWDDGVTTGQTLFGPGAPVGKVVNNQYTLSCTARTASRSRLDFAGNWQNGTIEVDLVNLGFQRHSVEFRTTNWNGNDSSYAYVVEVTRDFIEFHVGTNGGADLNTILGTFNFTNQLASGTYRLRVVINGSTFTAYLNGKQYLTVTDSTYSAAGMISLRNRNQGNSTITMTFDNFGVMSSLSGTWQSASTSISAVTTISTSTIVWDQSLSAGGTVLVQTSINGGSSWQTASNGGFIPGLTPGVSGTGKSLLVKATLSGATTIILPDLKSLSWSVLGGYAASGTRISPALDLTPAGIIGNSFVAWNSVLPSAATSVGVDTSIDGGLTWVDVTAVNGGPIPGLNTQPEPTADNFSVDSTSSYVADIGLAGTLATWAQDTSHSRITATGGASAVYLNTILSQANVDLLVDMDRSDAGGMIWCYVDNSNYYALSAADSLASVGTPNLMTLIKMSGGVQTTLATGVISWQRGVYKRFRATTNAGIITCFFDGAQTISYTDSSPLTAGQVGLYQSGSTTGSAAYALRAFGPPVPLSGGGSVTTTSRFSLLWVQPLGDSAIGQSVMTRVRLASTDSTVTPQVLDLTVAAYTPNIGVGALIPSADYRQEFMSKVLDDCAKQSNYVKYIDTAKYLHFNHRNTLPAPWILQSSSIASAVDLEADSNLKVEIANDLYRNRQTLKGVIYTGAYVENFQGDGQITSFPLTNPVAPGTVPIITLNAVVQKVAKKGTTGAQYYYAENDLVLAQDTSLVVLVSTDRLQVTYTGTYSGPLTVDNVPAQLALAPIEKGSGIVEAVEDVSGRNMFLAAATVYANQLLTRYCLAGRTLTFATYRNGLAVGQMISVQIPEESIINGQLLITNIDATFITQPNSTILWKYVCTCSELAPVGSLSKLLSAGIALA